MKGKNQSQEISVRGKEVFVGIDVHKESWQVTVRTEGEEVKGAYARGMCSPWFRKRKILALLRLRS